MRRQHRRRHIDDFHSYLSHLWSAVLTTMAREEPWSGFFFYLSATIHLAPYMVNTLNDRAVHHDHSDPPVTIYEFEITDLYTRSETMSNYGGDSSSNAHAEAMIDRIVSVRVSAANLQKKCDRSWQRADQCKLTIKRLMSADEMEKARSKASEVIMHQTEARSYQEMSLRMKQLGITLERMRNSGAMTAEIWNACMLFCEMGSEQSVEDTAQIMAYFCSLTGNITAISGATSTTIQRVSEDSSQAVEDLLLEIDDEYNLGLKEKLSSKKTVVPLHPPSPTPQQQQRPAAAAAPPPMIPSVSLPQPVVPDECEERFARLKMK